MANQRILFFLPITRPWSNVINKQSCRDNDLMIFVRKLVLVCLSYNIVFKAEHIPDLSNNLADALSRLQLQAFRQLAPAYMHPYPTCSHPIGRHSLLFVAVQSPAILFPTHKRAWALFRQFFESILHLSCPGLPISSSVLALFIAYSFDKQYAPSSVNTYVSALGFHVS